MRLGADVGKFALSVEGNDLRHLDADLHEMFRLFPEGPVEAWVVGGYRHLLLDHELDDGGKDVTADLEMPGPYLAFQLDF